MKIDACFDSHVHWPATGDFAQRLRLDNLKGPGELKSLSFSPAHQRGEWLLGFGWDDHSWSEKPHRRFLDELFPNQPVLLSRCDAHAAWVNTEALKRSGLWDGSKEVPGGRIERDPDGRPSGVLIDAAAEVARSQIPRPTAFELRRQLLKGVQIFNEAGYTHIRDMTADEAQWNEAIKLDQSGVLTLAVEEYFWLRSTDELDQMVSLAIRAKRSETANLRAMGLKVFFDGALGSEGAYLSRCYHGRDHQGLLLWDEAGIEAVLRRAWEEKIDLAVHVIGDEAADRMVTMAGTLAEKGLKGPLHLEHCELLRSDTITKMKNLEVYCHLQPSHWLSDRKWLEQKIGNLVENAFPWRRLQEAEIPFDFGSDAPIEPANISRLLQALRESADAGIPRLLGQPASYMSHKDLAWAPNSFTILEEEAPKQVVFRGEHLL